MIKNPPLISVIVSIYNTMSYLPRCIESILNQTYSNIEVLLINDGSTDDCGAICDKYAEKDNRISVIHKENTGQSDSQNLGIKIAKGIFVTFVDSDDYMVLTMLEILMTNIYSYEADISVCSYLRTDEPVTNIVEQDILLTGIEAMNDVFISGGKVNPETWGKVYKTCLFIENDIYFPVGYTAGDQHTTYQLMFYAKRVISTNQKLYRYTRRKESITGVSFTLERLNVLKAGERAIEFVKEQNYPLEKQALCFHIGLNLYLINQVLKDDTWRKWPHVLEELRETVLECSSTGTDRLLAKKRFVGVKLLYLGYWAYIPARKIFMTIGKG